ncbi:VIT domain-containing protein [Flaviaesturariibacter amylovorans]|uniref:VIT domain-containing protein n=1 Tax=Flaviaesturariibacter amylovorans TaxID=1084520 RepID=A0ABP8GBK5_9BACT
MRPLLLALLLFGSLLSHSQARFASNSGWVVLKPAQLARCKVEVSADPFIASTKLELEFYNPNDSVVEVRHYLNLDPDQAVTGLELDLNGHFREGSIEERWKARHAYQEITGQRIDPALLQMDGEGRFFLRVYPVPGHGRRRVRITLQQVLRMGKDGVAYQLPLSLRDTLQELDVSVNVVRAPALPLAGGGFLAGRSFVSAEGGYRLTRSERGVVPAAPVAFVMPLPGRSWYCGWQQEGGTGFLLHVQPQPDEWVPLKPKSALAVLDPGVLAFSRDQQRELAFLKEYIWMHGISRLTVLVLRGNRNDTLHYNAAQLRAGAWADSLSKMSYGSYERPRLVDLSGFQADVGFLVAGWNLSGVPVRGGRMPVFQLRNRNNTALHAEGERAEALPHVDLSLVSLSDAVVSASRVRSGLTGLRRTSGLPVQYYATTDGGWTVYGELAPGDTLQALYGDVRTEQVDGQWRLPDGAGCNGIDATRVQALLQYRLKLRTDWTEQLRFGARNGIVTYYASYIVLERVEDYIKYNIRPPKDLEEECARRNFVWQDRTHLLKDWTELELLQEAAAEYGKRLRMWNSEAPAIAVESLPVVKTEQAKVASAATSTAGTQGGQPLSGSAPGLNGNRQQLSEVVVVAMGQTRVARDMTTSVARVRSAEITQAKPLTLQQGLTGKVSGLSIQQTNSSVFADTRITLRGVRSLTGNNQPMLVVDGLLVPLNSISYINPNDISDVTILKSSSAAAIYGADGVNGAIVVTLKKGSRYGYAQYDGRNLYRLKDMEDEWFLTEWKETEPAKRLDKYRQLRQEARFSGNSKFYFDMAQVLHADGHLGEAMGALRVVLDSLAPRNHNAKRAAAYLMEEFGQLTEAIALHRQLLRAGGEIRSYRDLGLALYRSGHIQEAVDTMYAAVRKDWLLRGERVLPWKGLLLQDINMIAAAHRANLDLSAIPEALLRPVPASLRIVVQSLDANSSGYFEVATPNGKKITRQQGKTNEDGLISNGNLGDGFVEYQAAKERRGTYALRLRAYYSAMWDRDAPSMLRVLVCRTAEGQPPVLTVRNVTMDNQYGAVEFAEVPVPQ